MPHQKKAVAKEARGSRRSKVKKAGRRYAHLYPYLNVTGPRARDAEAGKQ